MLYIRTLNTTEPANTETPPSSLSQRLSDVWAALPPHIRATPTHYDSSSKRFLSLIITRLKFLQGDMHVHTILKSYGHSGRVWESLLKAAAEGLAHVLRIGSAQDTGIMLDFRDIVCIALLRDRETAVERGS